MPHQRHASSLGRGIEKGNFRSSLLQRLDIRHGRCPRPFIHGLFEVVHGHHSDVATCINFNFVSISDHDSWLLVGAEEPGCIDQPPSSVLSENASTYIRHFLAMESASSSTVRPIFSFLATGASSSLSNAKGIMSSSAQSLEGKRGEISITCFVIPAPRILH
jgi:hypothetical protein